MMKTRRRMLLASFTDGLHHGDKARWPPVVRRSPKSRVLRGVDETQQRGCGQYEIETKHFSKPGAAGSVVVS